MTLPQGIPGSRISGSACQTEAGIQGPRALDGPWDSLPPSSRDPGPWEALVQVPWFYPTLALDHPGWEPMTGRSGPKMPGTMRAGGTSRCLLQGPTGGPEPRAWFLHADVGTWGRLRRSGTAARGPGCIQGSWARVCTGQRYGSVDGRSLYRPGTGLLLTSFRHCSRYREQLLPSPA